MPIARPSLPSAISVPGPAPPEPSKDGGTPADVKPTPPIPADQESDLVEASSSGDHDEEGDGEEDYITASAGPGADPYASLGNAFGGYNADEPKPHTDDLLF